MKRTPFRTCPVCGCALDPAERCDCTEETATAPQRATAETARLIPPERAYIGSRYTRDASGNIRLVSCSLMGRPAPP